MSIVQRTRELRQRELSILIVLLWWCHGVVGEPPALPGCGQHPQLPTYPVEVGTDPCGQPGWVSRCWRRQYEGAGVLSRPTAPWDSEGLPLNLDLTYGVAPGNYLARSMSPSESSLALLPRSLVREFAPRPGEERPVLAGAVDLLTGVPLLQSVDLELPFGGAVFRQVRTYSEIPQSVGRSVDGGVAKVRESGAFWDWCGQGWMTGANPVLLIDGAWRDIVGSSARRAVFVPDAHHSIPFELDEQSGLYLPQARFRARLTHDGVWDASSRVWTERPTTYTVSLYDGAVRYTVVPSWADVGRYDTTSGVRHGHECPDLSVAQDGAPAGVPYLGLVKRIEDRHGNRLEITHAGELPGDALSEWHLPDPEAEADGCWRCAQACVDKGQVRAIKCYAPDQASAVWTVIFQHRRFDDFVGQLSQGTTDPWWQPENGWLKQQTALHALYAFKADLDLEADIDHARFRWVLPGRFFWVGPGREAPYAMADWDGLAWIEALDDLVTFPEFGPAGLPEDWAHQVQYRYSEASRGFDGQDHRAWILEDARPACDRPGGSARLLLARTITRRPGADAATPVEQHRCTVYRYGEAVGTNRAPLTHVFEPEAVDKLLHRLREHDPIAPRLDADYPEPLHDDQVHDRWSASWLLRLRLDQPLPAVPGDATATPTLEDAASLVLRRSVGDGPGGIDARARSRFTDLLNREFIQADPQRLMVHNAERQDVVAIEDRRVGHEQGAFLVHRFMQLPPAGVGDPLPSLASGAFAQAGGTFGHRLFDVGRSILHVPYRWAFGEDAQRQELGASPLDQPVWIAVVDRYGIETPTAGLRPFDAMSSGALEAIPVPHRRRVLHANATGQVLKQRAWAFDVSGDGTVVSNDGFLESFLTDDMGRVIEHRSVGWGTLDPGTGSVPSAAQRTDGRIDVFEYDGDRRDPSRLGVKRGTDGAVEWILERTHHPERADLVTLIREMPEPGRVHETRSAYELVNGPGGTPVVRSKRTWSRAVEVLPGEPPLHRIDLTHSDEAGRTCWHAYGMVEDPEAPGAGAADVLHVDYTGHDAFGRPRVLVSDFGADPSDPPAHWPEDLEIPGFPSGVQRSPAHEPGASSTSGRRAVQRTTVHRYGPYGLDETIEPSGLRSVTRYESLPGGEMTLRLFRALVPIGDGGSGRFARALEPGEVLELEGGTVVERRRVVWGGDGVEIDPADRSAPSWSIRSTRPTYDERGRLIGVEVAAGDASGGSVRAAFEYGETGGMHKLVSPEGRIVRTVRDRRGRPIARFVGSRDRHPYWGGLDDGDGIDDDMVLVEATSYGEGPRDADRAVLVRTFRTPPASQYDDHGAGGAATVEHRRWYDWKMRHVATQVLDADGAVHQTTFTHYDRLDAVRFEAVYGADAPWGSVVDPASVEPSQPLPSAEAFLGQSVRPLQLIESVYDGRGNRVVVRDYDVETGSFQARITRLDHDDRVVFSAGPTGASQHTRFDAFGNPLAVRSLAIAPDGTLADAIELERTEFVRDPMGRVLETRSFEQTGRGGTVERRLYRWCDLDGRVVAELDLGTASESGRFENDRPIPARSSFPDPPVRFDATGRFDPSSDPSAWLPAGASMTWFEYDERGREVASYRADERHETGWVVERTTYDDLDRVVERVVNADAIDATERLHLAMEHDAGRMVAMAVVRPGHVETHGAVRFGATDGTIQVARLEYGAPIIDGTGSRVSTDPGAIGALRLPGAGAIRFGWTPDGLLAGRLDKRGVRLRYEYGVLGDLRGMHASGPQHHVGGGLTAQVHVERDALRRPVRLETRTKSGDRLTETTFRYDGMGHLRAETQALAEESSARTIEYAWVAAGGFGQGGAPARLGSVTYPFGGEDRHRVQLERSYGIVGGIDHLTDRVVTLRGTLTDRTSTSELLATFERTGAGRVAGVSLGAAGPAWSAYDALGALAGLDRHGRHGERSWCDPSTGGLLGSLRVAYCRSGQRLNESLEWSDRSATNRYGYDGLGRLIEARVGGRTPVSMRWHLDDVGNRVGAGPSPGLLMSAPAIGWSRATTDRVGHVSALLERWVKSVQAETRPARSDALGDLVSDGRFLYRYDAWKRLVEVRTIGTVQFDGVGPPVAGAPGDVRVRLTYDGLGRLVRTEVPAGRSERWFYDGSQRVQIAALEPGGRSVLVESLVLHPDRIDEPIAISRPGGELDFVLHDPFGNPMATVTEWSRPVHSVRFGPYGSLVSLFDHGANAPPPSFGLHGMPVLRLDGAAHRLPDDPWAESDVLLHARHRTYLPSLGRFLQSDPHATGLPISTVSASSGAPPVVAVAEIDLERLYGDGPNLNAFVGGDPLNRRDPSGLFFGGLGGGLMTGLNGAEMALGAAEQGLYAAGLGASVLDMLQVYAIDQMLDVDWALDLSRPDHWHSRSGIRTEALYGAGRGAEAAGLAASDGLVYAAGRPARRTAFAKKRQHGGAKHWSEMRDQALSILRAGNKTDRRRMLMSMRTNQALVDANGHKVLEIRPDIQYVDSKGKISVIEVYVHPNKPSRGRRRMIRSALSPNAGRINFVTIRP